MNALSLFSGIGAMEPGIDPGLMEPIAGGTLGGNNRHFNRETGRDAQFGLSQQVRLLEGYALFRTPKADDPCHGSASEEGILRRMKKGQTIRLQDQVNHPHLFRTPDAGCARGAQSPERFAESQREGRLLTLNDQIAHLWPTPDAQNHRDGSKTRREAKGRHAVSLHHAVAMFPTPRASDAEHGGPNQRDSKGNLGLPAIAALYPTPTVNDSKNNAAPSQKTENGRNSDALNVVAGGSLNPAWVEWLMGLPIGWTDIGTPSRTSLESREESQTG